MKPVTHAGFHWQRCRELRSFTWPSGWRNSFLIRKPQSAMGALMCWQCVATLQAPPDARLQVLVRGGGSRGSEQSQGRSEEYREPSATTRRIVLLPEKEL